MFTKSSEKKEEIERNAQSIIRHGVWATSSPGSSRFPSCRYLIPNKAESTLTIKKIESLVVRKG